MKDVDPFGGFDTATKANLYDRQGRERSLPTLWFGEKNRYVHASEYVAVTVLFSSDRYAYRRYPLG
jgi:hypothetical protein